MCGSAAIFFCHFQREQRLFAQLGNPSKIESTLKRKNLLTKEQMFSLIPKQKEGKYENLLVLAFWGKNGKGLSSNMHESLTPLKI